MGRRKADGAGRARHGEATRQRDAATRAAKPLPPGKSQTNELQLQHCVLSHCSEKCGAAGGMRSASPGGPRAWVEGRAVAAALPGHITWRRQHGNRPSHCRRRHRQPAPSRRRARVGALPRTWPCPPYLLGWPRQPISQVAIRHDGSSRPRRYPSVPVVPHQT